MGRKIEVVKLIWKFRRWIKLKTVWALWKTRKPILNIISEVKKIMSEKTEVKNEPGKSTSEFILVILSNLIAVAGAFKGILSPEVTAIVLTVLNAIYSIARTLRKISADKKEIELKKIDNGGASTAQ